MPRTTLIAIACVLGLFNGVASAQDAQPSSKWRFLTEVYMMFPNMKGETAIRNLPAAEVDAGAGDILGHLKFGAMLYLEAYNDGWAVSSDLVYMDLGQEVTQGTIVKGGDLSLTEFLWEAAGLKRITPWLDAGLAGRVVSIDAALDLQTITDFKSGSISKVWFDPVIVVRTQGTVNGKWLLQFRGDVGGFGVGSDFTWQVQAYAGYRFSDLFQATIGYRYLGIDYDKGEDTERFLYNMDTFGAVVRLGFNF